jgi:hypothetical protein
MAEDVEVAHVERLVEVPPANFSWLPDDLVAAAKSHWMRTFVPTHPFPTCFGCGHARPEVATAIAASGLAWYLTAMGDTYARLTANQGFEQEVAAVLEAKPRPRPDTCVIPPAAERLLEQFAVIATPDTLNEALTIWDEASDVTLVGMPAGQPIPQLLAMVESAAPNPTANPPL